MSCSKRIQRSGWVESPVSAPRRAEGRAHLPLAAAAASVLLAAGALAFASAAALAAAPAISGEEVSSVGSSEATLSAKVNPGGVPTTYRVEYGTTTKYGSSTPEPETSVGAPEGAVGVQVKLSGLQPGTVYHARFVASDANHETTDGGDISFTTVLSGGAGTSTLPDGRVYEQVSSAANDGDGQVYVPVTRRQPEPAVPFDIISTHPVRAAAGGDRVAYVAEPLASDPGGNGNTGTGGGSDFIATRSASGWSAVDTTPLGQESENLAFTPELSANFNRFTAALPGAPECNVLYTRTTSDGVEHPAYGECGEPFYVKPAFAGASADGSRVFFERAVALTPEAPPVGESEYNLYESLAGRLSLVNVLPEGVPEGNAVVASINNAVSTDGSRVFWADLKNGNLYVRENSGTPQAKTVQVDASVGGGGEYWAASADGSKAFFTKAEDLHVFDVNTEQTTDLTAGGEVQGMVAASEDSSYVYFVAKQRLSTLPNGQGEQAVEGGDNVYLRHYDGVAWAPPAFVATLSPGDNAFEGGLAASLAGDWLKIQLRPFSEALELESSRTAEATPDGRHLVFVSTQSLTAYPNEGAVEVYLYDVGAGRITCASCNPSGQRPVARGNRYTSWLPTSLSPNYMLRWISEDGARVFFDSEEALVPQDTNGVQDVYEWERDGKGSCRQAAGCIYLISGSLSSDEAFLVDASASGDDVFFTSRGQLVPQDRNGKVDVYNARVNGGFPESSLACTGAGCQGVPPAPPVFATPPSVTFSGVGNFPGGHGPNPGPPKKRVKCSRGKKLTHGKCIKPRRKKKAKKASHNRRAKR